MTELPHWYFVAVMNSMFVGIYVDNFINNTCHFQINDARQLPIIVPSEAMKQELWQITNASISAKKEAFSSPKKDAVEEKLSLLQRKLDILICELYKV